MNHDSTIQGQRGCWESIFRERSSSRTLTALQQPGFLVTFGGEEAFTCGT